MSMVKLEKALIRSRASKPEGVENIERTSEHMTSSKLSKKGALFSSEPLQADTIGCPELVAFCNVVN